MPDCEITIFAEDFGHEVFLTALLSRLAKEQDVTISIIKRNASGGHGRVIREFREFLDDLRDYKVALPDLIVVASDTNCQGLSERKSQILDKCDDLRNRVVVCALPDPHVERWLLLDSEAFKVVLGTGCKPPDHKCDKGRYKRLLREAVREAGSSPTIGGLEYSEDIVSAMNLSRVVKQDPSLKGLIEELSARLRQWPSS